MEKVNLGTVASSSYGNNIMLGLKELTVKGGRRKSEIQYEVGGERVRFFCGESTFTFKRRSQHECVSVYVCGTNH